MDLKEFKKVLKIISPDEKKNKGVYEQLVLEGDCFGLGYSEESKECRGCTIFSEYKDKRAPLQEFCKELTETTKETKTKEKEKTKMKEKVVKEKKEKSGVNKVIFKCAGCGKKRWAEGARAEKMLEKFGTEDKIEFFCLACRKTKSA